MVVQLVPPVVSGGTPRVVAGVGLVHVVSPLMIITIATCCECFQAFSKTTLIGLLTVVHPNVLLEVSFLVEGLEATLACNWVLPFTNELHRVILTYFHCFI